MEPHLPEVTFCVQKVVEFNVMVPRKDILQTLTDITYITNVLR
jgi:hypothetical protein